MAPITTILRELVGLFVDDVAFAATILTWLAFAGLLLPYLGVSASVTAPALFVGLAAILIESVVCRARR